MWQAAEAYFESLDDAHMVLPGGRYSCAQALVSRGLEFLSGRSLGQVCHIVQLAISQKLLGFNNNNDNNKNDSKHVWLDILPPKTQECPLKINGVFPID